MPTRAQPTDFALIGHQETWQQISRLVHTLRTPDKPPLAIETLQEIVPWIPPRRVVRMDVRSLPDQTTVNGVYVETFITPDELGAASPQRALAKIRDAIRCAAREGVKIAGLGGFTSIILEGRGETELAEGGLVLTTGNSLTAAFIVKGLERAAERCGPSLADATLLIAGATGDIGTACARYFGGRTRRMLLSARVSARLARLQNELRATGTDAEILPVLEALPQADLVIGVASLTRAEWELADCRPDSIVCDAGYPKNLRPAPGVASPARVFHGGMGRIDGGWVSDSPLLDAFYRFPVSFIGHGCMLEAIVLTMERRYEPFSRGRGQITPARMEEIWNMAARHGIGLAPFFDHDGLWAEQPAEAAR